MTNLSIKCGANGKAKVKYEIDGMTLAACKARLMVSGIPMTKFIEVCMRSYAAKSFSIVDGDVQAQGVTQGTSHVRSGPGRPSKEKIPEPDMSPEENSKLPWQDQDPSKRTVADYKKVVRIPEELDSGENLHVDTEDENGKTWREYIEEDWLEERLKVADESYWFDKYLLEYIKACDSRFWDGGKRNYRFRQGYTWNEIIDLNQELTLKYYDIIDKAFPEPKKELS